MFGFNTVEQAVQYYRNPLISLFDRIKTTNTIQVFDNQNLLDGKHLLVWQERTNGAGASIAHRPNEASVRLTVGTVDGEYAIRQTREYFQYVAGNTVLISATAVMHTAEEGRSRMVGLGDDKNGIFFKLTKNSEGEEVWSIIRRSSVTGSAVDDETTQKNWNINKMDDKGINPATINITTIQLLVIEFLWQGAGGFRVGFKTKETIHWVHIFEAVNTLSTAFTSTPRLPIRYEIRNDTAQTSPGFMDEVCTSIKNEGSFEDFGLGFSVNNGVNEVAVTTRRPIFAMRLQDSYNSAENRRIARLVNVIIRATTNDALIEVVHAHGVSAVTGDFVTDSVDSSIEYSTNISAITMVAEHIIASFDAIAGQGSRANESGQDFDILDRHARIVQNFESDNSEYFIVFATAWTGTSNLAPRMSYRER